MYVAKQSTIRTDKTERIMNGRVVVSAVISLVLIVAPLSAGENSIAFGNLKAQGETEVNGMPVKVETTVFAGDLVSTKSKSSALLTLAGGNQVFVVENSAARFHKDSKSVTLERGALGVLDRGGDIVKVTSRGTLLRPAKGKAARYVVKSEGKGLVLSSLRGDVEVVAENRTVTVPSGTSMRIEIADPAPSPQGAGPSNSYANKKGVIIGTVVVGAVLAIALPLALRDDDEPVSP
jgi:hypothetical protein